MSEKNLKNKKRIKNKANKLKVFGKKGKKKNIGKKVFLDKKDMSLSRKFRNDGTHNHLVNFSEEEFSEEIKKMIKEYKNSLPEGEEFELIPCPNPSKKELKQMEEEYKDCFPKGHNNKYIDKAILIANQTPISRSEEAYNKEMEEAIEETVKVFIDVTQKKEGVRDKLNKGDPYIIELLTPIARSLINDASSAIQTVIKKYKKNIYDQHIAVNKALVKMGLMTQEERVKEEHELLINSNIHNDIYERVAIFRDRFRSFPVRFYIEKKNLEIILSKYNLNEKEKAHWIELGLIDMGFGEVLRKKQPLSLFDKIKNKVKEWFGV